MRSLTMDCVLLLQNGTKLSHYRTEQDFRVPVVCFVVEDIRGRDYRMCSLTLECVILPVVGFVVEDVRGLASLRHLCVCVCV